jgi:hypothetical protein
MVFSGQRADEFALRLQGASYEDIARRGGGIVSTVRSTRLASEEQLFEASAPRLEALLAEGVTAVEIKSGYGLDLATERKQLRVARRLGQHYPISVYTTFLGAHAVPPEYAGRADDYIEYMAGTVLPELAGDGLVDAVDVFCERIGFSAAQTERVFAAASSSPTAAARSSRHATRRCPPIISSTWTRRGWWRCVKPGPWRCSCPAPSISCAKPSSRRSICCAAMAYPLRWRPTRTPAARPRRRCC